MPLLQARQVARGNCAALDRRLIRLVQGDATCRMLMTMPGIGPITAVAYAAALEKADNFKQSRAVGAWLGLTPRRFQSGEVDYDGHISRRGDRQLRALLYEAAAVIDSFLAAQLSNAVLAAQAFQHDADLLLGRMVPTGGSADIPDRFPALSGMRLLACLIVAPQQGYDEPGIVSYAIRPFCPTSADGLQSRQARSITKTCWKLNVMLFFAGCAGGRQLPSRFLTR